MKANFLNHLSTLLLIGILFAACEKQDCEHSTFPECVQTLIDEIEKEEVTNPPREIYQVVFEGKTYFYLTAACCDQFSELYDEDCNLICAPDGGITGEGDGQCPEGFDLTELNPVHLYKDERKD